MNNIAIICNKYAGSLRRIINNPIATVEGEMSLRTFQDKIAPVFRMEYLDIVVLDHTALKEDFLEAVNEDWKNRQNEEIDGKPLSYYLDILGW